MALKPASLLTGYHSDYLGRLARRGKIESTRVGKQWFIEKESLLKLPRVFSAVINTPEQMENVMEVEPTFFPQGGAEIDIAMSPSTLVIPQ